MKTNGDMQELTCRILIPEGITCAKSLLNGKENEGSIEQIRKSYYRVNEGIKGSEHLLKINW